VRGRAAQDWAEGKVTGADLKGAANPLPVGEGGAKGGG
jgi:hypothetical protein